LNKAAIIGFDMGGTSTDVSRFAGEFEHIFETTVAGVAIQAPQVRNVYSALESKQLEFSHFNLQFV
jgi:N-methylhydantoinase A/oxoprolinase/acetone carboxylase beta subunit